MGGGAGWWVVGGGSGCFCSIHRALWVHGGTACQTNVPDPIRFRIPLPKLLPAGIESEPSFVSISFGPCPFDALFRIYHFLILLVPIWAQLLLTLSSVLHRLFGLSSRTCVL